MEPVTGRRSGSANSLRGPDRLDCPDQQVIAEPANCARGAYQMLLARHEATLVIGRCDPPRPQDEIFVGESVADGCEPRDAWSATGFLDDVKFVHSRDCRRL